VKKGLYFISRRAERDISQCSTEHYFTFCGAKYFTICICDRKRSACKEKRLPLFSPRFVKKNVLTLQKFVEKNVSAVQKFVDKIGSIARKYVDIFEILVYNDTVLLFGGVLPCTD